MADSCYIPESFWEEKWDIYALKLKRKQTRITYRREINQLCEYLKKAPAEISIEDAQRYCQYLSYKVQNGQMRESLKLLRLDILHAFFSWFAETEENMQINPFQGVYKENPNLNPFRIPGRRELQEIEEMMQATEMMQAVYVLVTECGAKVKELQELVHEDISIEKNAVFVQIGKGARKRIVPISYKGQDALRNIKKLSNAKQHIFIGQSGKPIQCRMLQRYYRQCVGEEFPYTMNDIRNSATVIALADSNDEDKKNVIQNMAINERWVRRYENIEEHFKAENA